MSVELPSHPRFQNLTDKTFNRLTVVEYLGKLETPRNYWLCTCVCGSSGIKVATASLVNGSVKSCGCLVKDSINKTRRSTEAVRFDAFILKAGEVHGDTYDYSSSGYKHTHHKINIRCKKHDYVFSQTPNSHLRGRGCPLCGNEVKGRWAPKSVKRREEETKQIPCCIYLINVPSFGNDIFKVGISKDLKTRLAVLENEIKSTVDIIYTRDTSLFHAVHCEDKVKRKLENKRFFSDFSFGGYTELFKVTKEDIQMITEEFNKQPDVLEEV